MREYSFKRGFEASEKKLVEALKSNFDSFEKINGGAEGKEEIRYIASIGDAEFELELKEKKILVITKNAGKNPQEALKRYNRFLETLTGYTAKERRKKMLKEMNSNSL